jgi:hypothetical protein
MNHENRWLELLAGNPPPDFQGEEKSNVLINCAYVIKPS